MTNITGTKQADPLDGLITVTPSEVLHAQALGILADKGKADDHTATEYAEALDMARLLQGDVYERANPTAAREERRRIERRLEIERQRSQP
jgi:hypothetical protein